MTAVSCERTNHTDPSVLCDGERAVLAARRRLRAKGIHNPSRERLAKEAGLSLDRADEAADLLRACGVLPPTPLQADRAARGVPEPGGRVTPAGREEIARRLAVVRAAKAAKATRADGRETASMNLEPHELDAILPDDRTGTGGVR